MSTETFFKKNPKIIKYDDIISEKKNFDQQISNKDLDNLYRNSLKKKKTKICINSLQKKLRKKEFKEKFENRIIYGLFLSFIAVLFYIST